MQGDSTIITLLNNLLTEELTSADQYLVHGHMYQNWGYTKLAAHSEHERQEEMTHATRLIDRILFLEGIPDVNTRNKVNVGSNVLEMMQSDLAYEYRLSKDLRAAIVVCEKQQDYVTRDILLGLLDDTERDHAYWLEQQVNLIHMMGLPHYLQFQLQS